jgi:hypothetical protein
MMRIKYVNVQVEYKYLFPRPHFLSGNRGKYGKAKEKLCGGQHWLGFGVGIWSGFVI